ncbi:hypothetical protein CI109_105423 [Kwoniella shandongensis]|uniref:Uncharacterized protein n=1 Tax=Kwoniella shandongensis TaxID=1734106 RepID=A0AAJ8MXC9_9TREE
MQSHRANQPTPPPLIRHSSRTTSSSTVSTIHTSYTQNSNLMPPSPHGNGGLLASPTSIGMGLRSASFSGASGGGVPGGDEVDKLGYLYSLRVAVLHHHLALPPPPLPYRMSSASSFSFASTPPIPPMPSPPLTGTSPNGSRFTFSSLYPSPNGAGPKTPDMAGSQTPPTPGRRKSSGFGLSMGKHKSDADVIKLPKEFLAEFWGTLASEDGDQGWKTAVSGFLSIIKKGTKTPSAFTASVPAPGPGSAPVHVHQSHLLQLLYNSLPRSSYFSPIAKPQAEKDRDFLFRLRAEVQSYMLAPSPDPGMDHGSNGMASPTLSTPKRSPMGAGRRASSTHSVEGVKRKPSPVWDGDITEMIDTVAAVWGVRKDVMDRDVMDIKGNRSIEQMYLSDLKRAMSTLSAQPPPLTPSQKNRQAFLAQALSGLMKDFPDLAMPTSPNEYNQSPLSPTSAYGPDTTGSSFFTPPRTVEIFGRLTQRAGEAGHNPRTRDLVEKCREIWGISSRREKEKEMEGLLQRWGDSIGTKDEVPLARLIAEGVKLMSFGLRDGDPLPPVLTELLGNLLSLATTSLPTIFPTTSGLPPSPPPSLLLIFNAASELFSAQPEAAKALENASDELKGGAVGEYVEAVEHLTGGIGQADDGLRHIGESGKDSMVEGFEKVALWMENEIAGVKRVWGKGLGSQLPLFLAELQVLDKPRGAASDVFTLYEATGKLLDYWDDLCPTQEHGFELDAFFEPHVEAWLRENEVNKVHDWVSRSVGMDSWVPEGVNKHSQSVIDLFEFMRGSAQVILHELPLSEYKRAIYLIDYSKHDLSPAKASTPTLEIQNKLGSKAGSWLAKGQQAVKSLERKKSCVKLTDMGAAQVSLEDLVYAMEAEETARIVKQHKLNGALPDKASRHVFTITILRGDNLLGRGLSKPADGEQSFEISVGAVKILELQAYDRQLVGKHDLIGVSSFKLDPRAFADIPIRDVVLPLSPRGTVHVRISMEGGEKHDVQYHLSVANRALERAAADMSRELVDKMGEFIKAQLSVTTLQTLTKPLKDKKKAKTVLTEQDIEQSLGPLFDYLNENLMLAIWRRIIDTLISLLVPPLSDKPSTAHALPSQEVDVVFKWLQLVKAFFNASEGGMEHGVPLTSLQAGPYKDIIMLGQYLDLPTPTLKERCSAAVRAAGKNGVVGGMRGLRLDDTGKEDDSERMAEVLLRIARTRPDTADFLSHEIAALTKSRVDKQAGVL